jgi:hypothetical protein
VEKGETMERVRLACVCGYATEWHRFVWNAINEMNRVSKENGKPRQTEVQDYYYCPVCAERMTVEDGE